jgi:hypothetical protein
MSNKCWAIVLDGRGSIRVVPFTDKNQAGLLCFTREGEREWHRVAVIKTTIVGHPHPKAPRFGDEEG